MCGAPAGRAAPRASLTAPASIAVAAAANAATAARSVGTIPSRTRGGAVVPAALAALSPRYVDTDGSVKRSATFLVR